MSNSRYGSLELSGAVRAGVIILELISIFKGFESHKTGQDRAGREGSRVSLSRTVSEVEGTPG